MAALRRLKKRPEFLFVRAGAKAVRPSIIIEARKRENPADSEIGVGFTASRKVGVAVARNRARRRLREAARKSLPVLGVAGADYVFVARPATIDAPWPRLLDDVQNALIRLRAELDAAEAGRPRRSTRKPRPAKAANPGATSSESD